MKSSRLSLLFWLLFCLLPGAEAKPAHTLPRRPVLPMYRLMPLSIRDANPPECIWLLEETAYGAPFAYKSLHAPGLLFWLNTLPKGTQIQYSAASYPIQGFHNEEVLPFAHRCREKGIVFSYQPGL
jgi:hypothetical protein